MSEIYGVETLKPGDFKHPFAHLADTPDGWRAIFNDSLAAMRNFLMTHDACEVIAKCVNQVMQGASHRKKNPRWALEARHPYEWMEAAELEILQALLLMTPGPGRRVPASPRNMERFFSHLTKSTYAFPLMHAPADLDAERDNLITKVRRQTMFHRNLFVKDDCITVVLAILSRLDRLALEELKFLPSEMFKAMVALMGDMEDRVNIYLDHARDGYFSASETEAIRQIEFLCSISPAAKNAWEKCRAACTSLDGYRSAAFQLFEIGHAWSMKIDKRELRVKYGVATVAFFEQIALRPGALAGANPEHFFMNNPIWRCPFVDLDAETFFLPLPNLFVGFPFQIFERIFENHPNLEKAYSDARAAVLEEEIEKKVRSAMPSGAVYRGVMWRDPSSGKEYENDIVALMGNTIFLFEAKSGKLDDVARRGGLLSLIRNFKELFVEPGEQASRLEDYLNGGDAKLWLKESGENIDLSLGTAKVVHKFSICMEHFAALTSAKHNLKLMGVIKDENAWAPVLSLGDLMLVWRYLDTEVSFFHYLTRRATLEAVIDFEGDEQDILSMYLINGLSLDQEKLKGSQIRFIDIDGVVRTGKQPRQDRSEFEIFGVPLRYSWRSALEEVYRDASLRHRFDILQVVLNQDPFSLVGIEQQVLKWKRGLGGKGNDILYARYAIGGRTFVLAVAFAKSSMTSEEWVQLSRQIAYPAAEMFTASDVAVFLRIKKSGEKNYDAISFHRMKSSERSGLSQLTGAAARGE